MFSVTKPASSACSMSCRQLEEDKPLSFPAHVSLGAFRAGGGPQGRAGVSLPCCSAAGSRDLTLRCKLLPVQMLTQVCGKSCLRDCHCACAADPVCSHVCITCLKGNKKGETLHFSKVFLFLAFLNTEGLFQYGLPSNIDKKVIALMCTLKIQRRPFLVLLIVYTLRGSVAVHVWDAPGGM